MKLSQKEIAGKNAVLITSGIIKITFPFDKTLIEQIKSLPGRRYHNEGTSRYWTCPLTKESVHKLSQWDFSLDQSLQKELIQKKEPISITGELKIPGLKMKLRPFQEEGVKFLEKKNGSALIADEMGLGKTVQTLAWLQWHPELRPAIVVTPASVKLNWQKECNLWMTEPEVQVLSGTRAGTPITGRIIIINYGILWHWIEHLTSINPKVLVMDECHYIKNSKALRTKAIKLLVKPISHRIGLSGTPIINRPMEAYNAIKIIDGSILPGFFPFAMRYCGAKHNGFGWDFTGASNTEELHEKLSGVMIRRLKKDVLKELPPKTRSVVPMQLSNMKEYKKAETDFISFVKETKGAKAAGKAGNAKQLARIEGLKQLAVKGKIDSVVDWIKDFLEIDGKLVVFATHKATIDRLMKEFENVAVKIDGSTSQTDRDKAIAQFQTQETTRLFVGNIRAAGIGITLTAASNVAFVELGWSPGEHDQAEDRIHRIGQEAESINIHYLLASDTIEESIARLIDRKREVLNMVLDGTGADEGSLLSQLIEEYSN